MTNSQIVDCKNLQEEVEKIESSNLFTPNDVLDSIKLYDASVEVIGFIDGMESPRVVGDQQQYNVFKFYLNNDNGRRVQVISWNDEIKRVLPYVNLNHIIHLDGIQARPPRNPSFNNGNVHYELLIRSNTIIENMGKYVPKNTLNEPIPTKLTDIANTTDRVILEGYIKTNFVEINDKFNKTIGCGSLTDGTYKLETHILNFNQENYNKLNIIKGDKVKIIGIMQKTEPIYLMVNCISDLQKLNGRMSLPLLLKGVQIPSKRKSDETPSKQQKISKKKISE